MKSFINSITLTNGLVQHATFSALDVTDIVHPSRPDGSITFVNAAGLLTVSQFPKSFMYDDDGTLGTLGTERTLYVGDETDNNFSGTLALWDTGNSVWVTVSVSSGTFDFDGGVHVVGGIDAAGIASTGTIAFAAPADSLGITSKAFASQTHDLFETLTSAGAITSRFNKDGYFMTRKVAAPSDGDLVASELVIWLDDTNGAGKVKFKAKTADGTVVTASINLA